MDEGKVLLEQILDEKGKGERGMTGRVIGVKI